MAEADDKGIPLEDYIKVKPEPLVRTIARSRRTSVHVGRCQRQRPCERRQWPAAAERLVGDGIDHVRSRAAFGEGIGLPGTDLPRDVFRQGVSDVQRLSTRRKKLLAGGVPVRHRWFWKKQNDDCKAAIERSHISRGRENFLAELSDWLREYAPQCPANGSKDDRRPSSRDRERPGSSAGTLVPAKIIPSRVCCGSVPKLFRTKKRFIGTGISGAFCDIVLATAPNCGRYPMSSN